jgi:hypothetical protein
VRRKNVKSKSEKKRRGSVNERSEWVQVKALEVKGGDDGKAGGGTEVVAVEEASKDRIFESGRIHGNDFDLYQPRDSTMGSRIILTPYTTS